MGVSAVESAVTRVLSDHGGSGAVAVVRWLVTGEHVDDNAGGVIVDRGWPLPGCRMCGRSRWRSSPAWLAAIQGAGAGDCPSEVLLTRVFVGALSAVAEHLSDFLLGGGDPGARGVGEHDRCRCLVDADGGGAAGFCRGLWGCPGQPS